MPDSIFKTRFMFLGVIIFGLFYFSNVYAGNPATPILPSDNIQDPGDPGTSWGGCGPTDSNCYVTVTFPISIQNTTSLFSTGLSGTGSGSSATEAIFFGTNAGNGATSANNSNFLGQSAGSGATGAEYSNFLGANAGLNASGAYMSNFIGRNTGNGATDAYYSNFIGFLSGYQATNASQSNFIGIDAGREATNASFSNFLGYSAGKSFIGNNLGSNNIIIGTNVSLPNATADSINIGGVLFGTGTYSNIGTNPLTTPVSGGRIGIGTSTPASKFDVTANGLGITQTNTDGILLVNTTAAAAGAQQISPAIRWRGNGWKTASTAASQTVDFRAWVLPVQGTTNPNGVWKLESSVNGGSYNNYFGVSAVGEVYFGGSVGGSGQYLKSQGGGSAAVWADLPTFVLTNGSGTTASGTAVNLGGTLTANTTIDGSQTYDIKLINNGASLTIPANGRTITIGDIDQYSGTDIFTVNTLNSKAYYDNATHTGLFGINTSSPTVSLDVLGNVLFTTNDGANSSFVIYNSDDAANMLAVNPADGFINFDEGANGYKVGIGMSNPSVALDVTGDIEYTGTITDVSDERLKENITDFGSGLSIINSIGVKNYNMIATPDKPETGFIAQNVQHVFPQAVSIVDPVNGYLGVSYVSFIPVLTKAIQELDLKVSGINNVIPDINSDTTFADKLIAWLANAGNRITRIFTGELCLTDPDGTSECINKSQLGQLKQLINNQTPPPAPEQNNPQPPVDICPNIEGIQVTVPDGLHLDESKNCIENQTIETTPTEPQNTNQENNNSATE